MSRVRTGCGPNFHLDRTVIRIDLGPGAHGLSEVPKWYTQTVEAVRRSNPHFMNIETTRGWCNSV